MCVTTKDLSSACSYVLITLEICYVKKRRKRIQFRTLRYDRGQLLKFTLRMAIRDVHPLLAIRDVRRYNGQWGGSKNQKERFEGYLHLLQNGWNILEFSSLTELICQLSKRSFGWTIWRKLVHNVNTFWLKKHGACEPESFRGFGPLLATMSIPVDKFSKY